MPRAIRILALILALLGLLGICAASAAPAHAHANAPANTCSICFVAHLTASEPVCLQVACELRYGGRAALAASYFGYRPYYSRTFLTRGPPSFPS